MRLQRIVTVSKDPKVQQLAQRYSKEVFGADDLADALGIIQTVNPSLILFDHRCDESHIGEFIKMADKNLDNIPVLVVGTKDVDTDLPTDFAKIGIHDYLQGKEDYYRLDQIINKMENVSRNTDSDTQQDGKFPPPCLKQYESRFFAEDLAGSVSMVGKSQAILHTLRMIRLVAKSQCYPILIVGETGTGKELVAQAIHILRHPNERFVAVNCAALTATLLESELFGHVKGAFTGADRDKTGLFELAGPGTLLLDEISEMPIDLQAKLLRVLQEKCFRKVGGIKDVACHATIIASSNRSLKREVQAKRFRRDLYYRLDVSPIVLAPLRSPERRDDIRLLAEYFLEKSTMCPEKRDKVKSLTKFAIEALENHDWPGNVRELRNVIERAVLLETTDKIGLSSIVINSTEYYQESDNPTAGLNKNFSLVKAERELICRALQKTGWQKTRAAALLGITRATLYAKLKQYNIKRDPCEARDREEKSRNEISALHISEAMLSC